MAQVVTILFTICCSNLVTTGLIFLFSLLPELVTSCSRLADNLGQAKCELMSSTLDWDDNWAAIFKTKAYFPLGDFIRATRSENKNPATCLFKTGWGKNSPRTSRKRFYFFVCSREQSRQVESRLKLTFKCAYLFDLSIVFVGAVAFNLPGMY